MDRTLICTVGLPRSGKSTWAKEQGVPIVNPDSIRLAVYGQAYWAPGEKMVWAIVEIMVKSLFSAGCSIVILDATGTIYEHRLQWQSEDWDTFFKVFDTDLETCIDRAIADNRQDLIPIIQRMAENYEPLFLDEMRLEDD